VVIKDAVTFPSKAEFVSDMVQRKGVAVSKDVLIKHKKVGFVPDMVPRQSRRRSVVTLNALIM